MKVLMVALPVLLWQALLAEALPIVDPIDDPPTLSLDSSLTVDDYPSVSADLTPSSTPAEVRYMSHIATYGLPTYFFVPRFLIKPP